MSVFNISEPRILTPPYDMGLSLNCVTSLFNLSHHFSPFDSSLFHMTRQTTVCQLKAKYQVICQMTRNILQLIEIRTCSGARSLDAIHKRLCCQFVIIWRMGEKRISDF